MLIFCQLVTQSRLFWLGGEMTFHRVLEGGVVYSEVGDRVRGVFFVFFFLPLTFSFFFSCGVRVNL